jgi:hypothetical protein
MVLVSTIFKMRVHLTHPQPALAIPAARVFCVADERRLVATMSVGSRRDIVCKNLPYTWRELVPFSCPVAHPELMSYDPSGYHSLVANQTRDIGMRMIDLEAGNRHRSSESRLQKQLRIAALE